LIHLFFIFYLNQSSR